MLDPGAATDALKMPGQRYRAAHVRKRSGKDGWRVALRAPAVAARFGSTGLATDSTVVIPDELAQVRNAPCVTAPAGRGSVCG